MDCDTIPSFFSDVKPGVPDAIFGVQEKFLAADKAYKALPSDHPDAHPNKAPISLVIGAYRDGNGKPWVLPVVAEMEKELAGKENHEYLKMGGLPDFCLGAQKLIFGHAIPNAVTVQALSGTGSLFLGFTFLKKCLGCTRILFSKPTWGNHFNVAAAVGLEGGSYPYYNSEQNSVAFEELLAALREAPAGTAICFHPCAHNPTGYDLTHEQWDQVAHVLLARKTLIPFFDSAYQGYASGDLDEDIWPVRMFVQRGLQVFVAQSFSKNMGLYGERVGALHVTCRNAKEATNVRGQLENIIRPCYSNPPSFGARIACGILGNERRFEQWRGEMKIMCDRITLMRKQLREKLIEIGTPGNWDHITTQIGMFSYTGLKPHHVQYLADKHKIFLLGSGRVSIAALREGNVERVARAIKDAILNASPAPAIPAPPASNAPLPAPAPKK